MCTRAIIRYWSGEQPFGAAHGLPSYRPFEGGRKLTFQPGWLLTRLASLRIILASPKGWSTTCPGSWSVSLIRLVELSGDRKRKSFRDWLLLMTAMAMIIGMIPMALGLREGGGQNAPWAER